MDILWDFQTKIRGRGLSRDLLHYMDWTRALFFSLFYFYFFLIWTCYFKAESPIYSFSSSFKKASETRAPAITANAFLLSPSFPPPSFSSAISLSLSLSPTGGLRARSARRRCLSPIRNCPPTAASTRPSARSAVTVSSPPSLSRW